MRKILELKDGWEIAQHCGGAFSPVSIPHTWNALDGQDGGGDYDRSEHVYRLHFARPEAEQVFIRFEGVNHTAAVHCNGRYVGTHRGGYSAFTMELTEALRDGVNRLAVHVSNGADAPIYPQTADFTFFGGIYRPVSLICVGRTHFDMGFYGGDGVFLTPAADGTVRFTARTCGGKQLHAAITDPQGRLAVEGDFSLPAGDMCLRVDAPLLWDGVEAPNLYRLSLTLDDGCDYIELPFGFRSFAADPEQGFLLNGRPYPLHGVARHQDRENMGNALTDREHAEDIALIREIGANTVRLAHYQQAQYVYDLCDRYGLVVWAEIPFISQFDSRPEALRNAVDQLWELIIQSHHHPCICFWGIANEINIAGESPELYAQLEQLNTLAHQLDPSRLTAMANLGKTPVSSPLWRSSDIAGCNLYLGWYDGTYDDFGEYLDSMHAQLPDRPLAYTEYGGEAVPSWHSDAPKCLDYTEEYQALLHERAYSAMEQRPWLLATWLWTMFDFAADHREEGGCKGRNNKGLVTFDRKVKKDAFYFYKACWSKEPFVYITGHRYTRRASGCITVKVYSNLPSVTLTAGGYAKTQEGNRIFLFENVPLGAGETVLTATAKGAADSLTLERIAAPDPVYVLPQPEKQLNANVRQWFADFQPVPHVLTVKEGFYSVEDSMDTLLQSPAAWACVEKYWAAPLELSTPQQAARMRKGGALSRSPFGGTSTRCYRMNPSICSTTR